MLKRLAAQTTRRRTALPAEHYERQIRCTRCTDLISVFEATLGAHTDLEHQHIDPDTYVCGDCLVVAS